MLHGHTKIELNNVKTGITKVIEHDNMLTNAFRDLFSTYGATGRSITGTFGNAAYSRDDFFNGILLFENELDADADNYAFPADNKMIANAGNIAYSGADLNVGSFNEGLSELANDHATYVWDWTQERGNGTISALGLSSKYGGICGAGKNAKSSETSSSLNPVIAQFKQALFGASFSEYIIGIDEVNGLIYTATYSSPTLTLKVYDAPLGKVNPIRYQYISNGIVLSNKTLVETRTITSSVTGNVAILCADLKIYVTARNVSWNAGASKQFFVYDIASKEQSTITITNNTGEQLYIMNSIWYQQGFCVYDGYIYCGTTYSTTDQKIGYIKIADNTDAGVLKMADGNDYMGVPYFVNLFGSLYVGSAVYNNGTYLAQVGIVRNKTVKFMNAAGIQNRGGSYASYYIPMSMNLANESVRCYISEIQSNSMYLTVAFNPITLMTKNNLDEPVTKTADMTMRVTYTIQEEEE